jgi:uracil-DNA glycosylase
VWLRKELELIRPRVVILLGEIPGRDFLSRYGLEKSQQATVPWGARFECEIPGWRFAAFVLPHFSYRFRTAFVEAVRRETAQQIRRALNNSQ